MEHYSFYPQIQAIKTKFGDLHSSAPREGEPLAQPLHVVVAELGHVVVGAVAAEDCADGRGEDVAEGVPPGSVDARVRHHGQVSGERLGEGHGLLRAGS